MLCSQGIWARFQIVSLLALAMPRPKKLAKADQKLIRRLDYKAHRATASPKDLDPGGRAQLSMHQFVTQPMNAPNLPS